MGDFKELGGRDDLLYVCQSSSPANGYLFNGLMIKSSQWWEQKLYIARLHEFTLIKADLAAVNLSP